MKSILIVDDDPVYARMVREWLKDDYQAFVVISGKQTLKFMTMHEVDLILLDYEMPEMSGPETLRAVRELPGATGTTVMFLSGAVDEKSVQEIQSLDTAGFIPKTTTKDDFLEEVKKVWSDSEKDC